MKIVYRMRGLLLIHVSFHLTALCIYLRVSNNGTERLIRVKPDESVPLFYSK